MCSLSRHGKLDYFTFILKHQLVHLFFLQNAEVLADFTNKIWGMEHLLQQLLAVLLSPPLALSPNPTLFSAASLIWENGYRFFKVLLSQSIHQSLSMNCCSCWARNLSICCIVKFHFFPLSRIFKFTKVLKCLFNPFFPIKKIIIFLSFWQFWNKKFWNYLTRLDNFPKLPDQMLMGSSGSALSRLL